MAVLPNVFAGLCIQILVSVLFLGADKITCLKSDTPHLIRPDKIGASQNDRLLSFS